MVWLDIICCALKCYTQPLFPLLFSMQCHDMISRAEQSKWIAVWVERDTSRKVELPMARLSDAPIRV